jgi:hypothetical protein
MFKVEVPVSAFTDCARSTCKRQVIRPQVFCGPHAAKVYVADHGNRFHIAKQCRYLRNVYWQRVSVVTVQMAVAAGDQPCTTCFPAASASK